MKTRSGFVSNSSSSSFVLVGIPVEKYPGDDDTGEPDEGFDPEEGQLHGFDFFSGDGDYYAGVGHQTSGDEYALENGSMDMAFIQKTHDEMKAKLEPLGLWDEKKFGLHYGTLAC